MITMRKIDPDINPGLSFIIFPLLTLLFFFVLPYKSWAAKDLPNFLFDTSRFSSSIENTEMKIFLFDLIGKFETIVKNNPSLYAPGPDISKDHIDAIRTILEADILKSSKLQGAFNSIAFFEAGEFTIIIPGNRRHTNNCGDQSEMVHSLTQLAHHLIEENPEPRKPVFHELIFNVNFEPSANEWETLYAQNYCSGDKTRELSQEQRVMKTTRSRNPEFFSSLSTLRIPCMETLQRLGNMSKLGKGDMIPMHETFVGDIGALVAEIKVLLEGHNAAGLIQGYSKLRALDIMGPLTINYYERLFDENISALTVDEAWKFRYDREKRNEYLKELRNLRVPLWAEVSTPL